VCRCAGRMRVSERERRSPSVVTRLRQCLWLSGRTTGGNRKRIRGNRGQDASAPFIFIRRRRLYIYTRSERPTERVPAASGGSSQAPSTSPSSSSSSTITSRACTAAVRVNGATDSFILELTSRRLVRARLLDGRRRSFVFPRPYRCSHAHPTQIASYCPATPYVRSCPSFVSRKRGRPGVCVCTSYDAERTFSRARHRFRACTTGEGGRFLGEKRFSSFPRSRRRHRRRRDADEPRFIIVSCPVSGIR